MSSQLPKRIEVGRTIPFIVISVASGGKALAGPADFAGQSAHVLQADVPLYHVGKIQQPWLLGREA